MNPYYQQQFEQTLSPEEICARTEQVKNRAIKKGDTEPLPQVVIADIHMSFGSMVLFMVKWAIAALPAIIILWLILMVIGMLLGGIGGLFTHR